MFARNNEGKLDYKKIIIESGLYRYHWKMATN